MPHLSPIIWLGLYILVWFTYLLLLVSFEFNNFSLVR